MSPFRRLLIAAGIVIAAILLIKLLAFAVILVLTALVMALIIVLSFGLAYVLWAERYEQPGGSITRTSNSCLCGSCRPSQISVEGR